LNKQVAANWFDQQGQRLYVDRKWAKSLEFRRRSLDIDPLHPEQRPIYVWLTRGWLKETDAATAELAALLDEKKLPLEEWNAKVASLLAGKLTEEELFKAAETKDENTTKGRKCEAFFFAAEKRHVLGDIAGAKELYRRCLEQNQRNFLENYLAEKRLGDLEKK
jgi:lipoprotein NlpI